MRDLPIIFSGPMIPPILDGRKTQTRRVVRPQPPSWIDDFGYTCFTPKRSISGRGRWRGESAEKFFKCPFGAPGDRLWVQEGYQIALFNRADRARRVSGYYLVDGTSFNDFQLTELEWSKLCARKYPMRATPGRFMYKSLARIWLEVLSVKVEKVQEISEEDAQAEGCLNDVVLEYGYMTGPIDYKGMYAVERFEDLWDSLYAKRGYGSDVNPWVWAVSFKRLT